MSKTKWAFTIVLAIFIAMAGTVFLFAPHYVKQQSKVTQVDYSLVVKRGMSAEALKEAFGEPVLQRDGPDGSVIFSYLAPAPTSQDIGKSNQFAGFEVAVKDGVVVNSYITTRTTYLSK